MPDPTLTTIVLAAAASAIPDGTPGVRDPDDPCHLYEPRPRRWNDFPDCWGDGHHLCKGCWRLDVMGREEATGG